MEALENLDSSSTTSSQGQVLTNSSEISQLAYDNEPTDSTSSQLILLQRNLRTLPAELVERYAEKLERLDLSYNCLKDLAWLSHLDQLTHLVLDSNRLHEAQLRTMKQPLPQLQVLMLNKNEFSDLHATMQLIKWLFPNLEYLSLHGNPICPDGLVLQPFSTYLQYNYDYYSNYIARSLSKLKFLDHGVVQRKYQYESFCKSFESPGSALIKTTSF